MFEVPTVSVVVPTARRPQLVKRAVMSILDQTMASLEVIVVVDGEDPETVVSLATVTDSRMRIVINTCNLGACASRNRGVELARGSWIAFLDDDDEWLPTKLEMQLSAGQSAGRPAIVTSRSRVITPIGEFTWPTRLYTADMRVDEYLFDRRSFFKGDGFVQTSSLLIPRDVFMAVRFDHLPQHEDWDFLIRSVAGSGVALIMLPQTLVIHQAENDAPSLSSAFDWRESVNWIARLGPLVSARARSGFYLTIIAPHPARSGEYRAFSELLSRAVFHGRPTPRQLMVFLAFWILPMGIRRRLRWVYQSGLAAIAGLGTRRSLPHGNA